MGDGSGKRVSAGTERADPDWGSALHRARAHSRFLADALDRQAELAGLLAAGQIAEAERWTAEAGRNATSVGSALRRERLALATSVAVADLAGALDLDEVTGRLSAFADRALDAAIADAIAWRCPDAQSQGFIAIALGKHGGEELNYSSDIDPIFLYDPDTLPRRGRDEPGEAAQRIASRIIETLGRRDAEGYVLRVDMRLRPASEVSPLAIPVDTALAHYESSALAWEQAAFIRSRAAAGDVAAGQRFLDAIRPFIWRRSLDFGMLREIGALTRQIRDHHSGGGPVRPGFDIKRGRGGIREVEFFAQVHQLIHGGRDASLRSRRTVDALAALVRAGHADPDIAAMLADSYELLRTIEHRLQMVDDHQTHQLPADPAALERVARLHGLADGQALLALLDGPMSAVGAAYDALVLTHDGNDAQRERAPADADQLAALATRLGYPDPDQVARRIAQWRGGAMRAIRSRPAREAMERVLPALLRAFSEAPDPMRAFLRWDGALATLPSALNIFELMEARPGLLVLVATIFSHAPALADLLGQRGDLLDGLIDASALDPLPPLDVLEAGLARQEAGDDYQRLLDRVRDGVSERRFALGAQLVTGGADPVAVARDTARLAEAALRVLTRATVAEFEAGHGRVPGAEFIVLALGRLGGEALTHASDLDLVYLFTGAFDARSDGARSLSAFHYFNRLASRVSAALSVPTPSGTLFEVDTRLRPSGAKGPLAVSTASFLAYQSAEAWTWEHMAMTRARPVFGSPAATDPLMEALHAILVAPRDRKATLDAIAAMRIDMAAAKPPLGELDVKLLTGGLVDLEFIVHACQLCEGTAIAPRLDDAVAMLVERDLLPPKLREDLALYTRLLVLLRLVAPDCAPPPEATRPLVARACGQPDWPALLEQVAEARHRVGDTWRRLFGPPAMEG